MKTSLRLSAFLLSLLLLLSLCACALPLGPFVPKEIPEPNVTAFGERYGEQLNPNERAVYDAVAAAEAGESLFTVLLPLPLEVCRGRSPDETEKEKTKATLSRWLSNAVFAVWLDVPSLFWLNFSDFSFTAEFKQNEKKVVAVTEITLTLTTRTDADTAKERAAALEQKLKTIAPTGATEADKLYALDYYLSEHIVYDLEAPDRATVTGALLDGACVCEGYAHAFQLICQRLGILCVCILGDATAEGRTEAHMWNAVRIDGAWYYCDPTWNDSTYSVRYLLVGSDTMGHEMPFKDSHVPRASFGKSKTFLLPTASPTAYRP